MISYPLSYNPILEYWERIENGTEVVCDKIRRTYKKVVIDLNKKDSEWFYSAKRANHIIEFAENFCRHSKGKQWGGKKIVLELWEKALLATIFGFINKDGIRKYQNAILIVGKKNGKSLISSIIGLYMMVFDNEPGAEVYAVATQREQAKIVWEEAKRMVNKSPTLKSRIRTLIGEMRADFNESVFRPLASKVDSLDGKNVHCALMDEVHQWRYGMALFDIIADGTTARESPLIFITSTAGTVREDIYDQKYDEAKDLINGYEDENGYKDERTIAFIYELDKRAEWTDETTWKKANPGLGTIKNITILRDKVERAKARPELVRNLICKEFNIPETSSEAWLTFEQLNNEATYMLEELKPNYGIGGTDLSITTDLTAAKAIFMVPNDFHIYSLAMYWIPEELFHKRITEDKMPYEKWYDLELLRLCPGNKIHPKVVTEWYLELMNDKGLYLPWIGYDYYSAEYWVEEMRGYFGKDSMIPIHQGKKTLSAPMYSLAADLESKIVVYNNNPIDKWCLSNSAVDRDKNGNIQLCKTHNQRRRVDGTAALIDAYVVLQDKMQDYQNMI